MIALRVWTGLVGCVIVLAGCVDSRPVVVSATEAVLVEQSPLVEGRDGGQSALLWGYSVWTFGDTVLKVFDERRQNWHHNSFALTTDLDAADGITGFVTPLDRALAPRYLLASTREEQAFNDAHAGDGCANPCGARWAVWPGAPVYDAIRDSAIIPYALVYAEPGEFNFRGVGQSFAVWRGIENEPERPVVDPTARHPTLLFREGEPAWGSGPVVVDDRFYVFACEPNGLARPCFLANVPLEAILDRSAWRYYDGRGWSTSMKDAVPLFDGGASMSVAFNRYLGRYLAVYSPPFSHNIMARTASRLEGPWSRERVLYTVRGPHPPHGAVHHVEYDAQEGRVIYVSYSRPTSGWFGSDFVLIRIVLESAERRSRSS